MSLALCRIIESNVSFYQEHFFLLSDIYILSETRIIKIFRFAISLFIYVTTSFLLHFVIC